jgi:hypothetical protein
MIWGSHNCGYEDFCLLGYNAVHFVESKLTFQKNMSPPSSGSKNKPRKQMTSKMVSCFAYASTLKMDATCSSVTQLSFNGLHGVISYKIEPSFEENIFRKCCKTFIIIQVHTRTYIQCDSKLLSVFSWPVIFKSEEQDKTAHRIWKCNSKSFIWQRCTRNIDVGRKYDVMPQNGSNVILLFPV